MIDIKIDEVAPELFSLTGFREINYSIQLTKKELLALSIKLNKLLNI